MLVVVVDVAHEEDSKRTTRGLCKSINQSREEEAGVECNY